MINWYQVCTRLEVTVFNQLNRFAKHVNEPISAPYMTNQYPLVDPVEHLRLD